MPQASPGDPTVPEHASTATPALPGGRAGVTGATAHLRRGDVISRYRIESILGEGGMGVVYLARQERPDRLVALKVIRPGFAHARMLKRFEHEAEVLGRLLHPGIAQIYEAGMADAGHGPQPFFAMELVRGQPLTEYASEKQLSTRQRLELMAKVCDAVEHAHQKGVIHRDLKPGNILVTEDGQPKILDFGVARATDSDIQQTTMQTDVGALVGTLPYMSPEQVGGDPDELDTRSDVYALGVVLFELLAGRLPYSLERRMIHEAARVIREEEPTRLSSINKTLGGDVETIVSHALEKEKSRRYQAASALAADLRRYLAHEPIAARPASTWYQLTKFSRRNRGLVGGVAAAFAVLLLGLGVSLYAFAQASYQRDEKDKALTLAKENEEKAIKAAEDARASQEAEKERADELDQVAAFQAAQFEGLDTQLMGIRLRQEMIADAVGALEKSGLSAEEVAQAKQQLEEILARGNPTNVALKSLYDNIFAPALKAVDEQFADQPLVRARLLGTIAYTLQELGLLDEAMEPQAEALTELSAALGPDHPDVLSTMTNQGLLLLRQSKTAEAEPYLRGALEKHEEVFGADHPVTLRFLVNMGGLVGEQGDLGESERYLRAAMESYRRVLGEDHPEFIISMNNLGANLLEQGRVIEAEPLLREAVEKLRAVPESMPALSPISKLVAIHNLASLLEEQQQFDEAELLYRESLEGCRRTLGDSHPLTLTCIRSLVDYLEEQQRLQEAEYLGREAVERSRRLLGREHPETLALLNRMARVLQAKGKLAEAAAFYGEELEASRRVLGDEHPDVVRAINNVGAVLLDQGRFQEAEALLREGLDRSRHMLGNEDIETLISLNNMGVLLDSTGRLDEAELHYREALQTSLRVLGEDDENTLRAMNNLGVLCEMKGTFAEAEGLLRRAISGYGRLFGVEHWLVANSKCHLGRVLTQTHRFAEAEEELLDAAGIFAAAPDLAPTRRQRCASDLLSLYTAWHAAEPGKGYDAKAAEWRAKLEALQASTRPATNPCDPPVTAPSTPPTQPATQPSTEPSTTGARGEAS